jgi:two-component system, OmpR family, sensor kinase
MSPSRMSRGRKLLRRLLRVQLRIKVMAGVVVVTLIALVAFDVGAVATMRRYLIGQTDSNLHVALILTVPRLAGLLAAGGHPFFRPGDKITPRQRELPQGQFPPLFGAYGITFLPSRGQQVQLQAGVNPGGPDWVISPRTAKVAARPGAHTVSAVKGNPEQIRLDSIHILGGSLVVSTSLDQVAKTIDQVEVIVIFGSIAVVLLIGFGVFLMLRRGLRPIETMARQADRITGGDLTDRVTSHNPRSEVGRLGAALNGMLARIEADVHEREASQQQMRRFFADASHELRTPLASLRANAELYQQGALGSPDEVDVVMDRIVAETRRMGRLVDDMLRLARLGQHPGQSQEPVDVTAVATGCAERIQVADPARTWDVWIDEGLTAVGDEELLRRAIDNLLMNVLMHTPAGTVGSISVSASGDVITIDVADDGPGVAPDKLPHLFERFYRAGAWAGRPGSGLGLAIAAEIASAHGGTAQAAPVSPHGLQITLTIPARCAPEPRSAPELPASAG